jgi:hypothetical protein
MSQDKQKPAIDPVVIVMLGIVFLAVAIGLFVFQPNAQSINFNAGSGAWGQLVVAFVTGVTTGGLSCLAMQGGLLASSLAHQIESAAGIGASQNYQRTAIRSQGGGSGERIQIVTVHFSSSLVLAIRSFALATSFGSLLMNRCRIITP